VQACSRARVCVCVCACVRACVRARARAHNLHLSGIAGLFRSIMLSPTDVTFFVAFGRKILIEEDDCSSSSRIWVAAVILTVYNETPLRGASRWSSRERTTTGNWILRRMIAIYITKNDRREATTNTTSYRTEHCCRFNSVAKSRCSF